MDTANLRAMESVTRRISGLEDFVKGLPSAGNGPANREKQLQVQKQKGQAESQIRTLQEELRLRKELARAEQEPGNYLEIAENAKKLNEHLRRYPNPPGSFQVTTDPCFTCGGDFEIMQRRFLRFNKDVQGKKQRRKERLELIKKAREKSAKMPERTEKLLILKAADDFAQCIDAAEKAVLSRDAYHYTDAKIAEEGAPVGYLRGSEHPEILKRYGVTPEMMAPSKSGFRVELYIPDPQVFGPDAKPVLVFKGTDPNCMEDVATDLAQAQGKDNFYYRQAINLGNILRKATGGNFETAGHSLGGGMATAVGIITGCKTTVYNPAGLHENMLAPFNKCVNDVSNVSSFIVEGEVLNAGQDAVANVGKEMGRFSANSALPFVSPVRLVPLLLGNQLISVPTHVGTQVNLPSTIGGKKPDPVARHSMTTVIASVEQEKSRLETTLKKALSTESGGATHAKGMA